MTDFVTILGIWGYLNKGIGYKKQNYVSISFQQILKNTCWFTLNLVMKNCCNHGEPVVERVSCYRDVEKLWMLPIANVNICDLALEQAFYEVPKLIYDWKPKIFMILFHLSGSGASVTAPEKPIMRGNKSFRARERSTLSKWVDD